MTNSDIRRVWIYPVIHVANERQVLEQAAVADEAGSDGVFLIDHDANHDRLLDCATAVRERRPELFLGVNLIRVDPLIALKTVLYAGVEVDALWSDDVGLDPHNSTQQPVEQFAQFRADSSWQGRHFGGIAFKHQRPVADEDLPRIGELARRYIDVPTTSGPATGEAASLDKLRALRAGLGPEHPFAVASGVTVDNVAQVLGIVDQVLVASGVSRDFHTVDPELLSTLIAIARGGRANERG